MPSRIKIKRLERYHSTNSTCYLRGAPLRSNHGYPCLCAAVAYLRSLFLPRHKLALEAVALRQQLPGPNWIASIGCSGWSSAGCGRAGRPGRPQVNAQIRQLIRRMKAENPTLGAPRISRRTAPARLRDFRAHGFALSSQPKRLSGRGQREARAGLSQQPPRGNRRIRLLHGSEL